MATKGIYLDKKLLTSKAWMDLGGVGKSLYGIFRLKCRMIKHGRKGKEQWSIDNNGEIEFTYAEAEKKYRLTAPRFCRGLDDMIDKGFIDIEEIGGGVNKYKTKFTISDRWKLYGTKDFKAVERPKRSTGWPGFKKNITNRNVRGTTNENVRGTGINTYAFIRGMKYDNLLKWRNNKWLNAKIA